MSDHGNGAVTPASRAQKQAAARGRAEGLDVGWTVSGYLISGMVAYGIIGWLIGRAVHVGFLFPVGMLSAWPSRSASSSTATEYRERRRSPGPAQKHGGR